MPFLFFYCCSVCARLLSRLGAGWGLGENGIWCKVSGPTAPVVVQMCTIPEQVCVLPCQLDHQYCVFENQVHVPMMVRVPWLPHTHGRTTDAVVEVVDMMPSLLDLAGILPQALATESLDGDSFAPLLHEIEIDQASHTDAGEHRHVHVSDQTFSAAFSQYPRSVKACVMTSDVHSLPELSATDA